MRDHVRLYPLACGAARLADSDGTHTPQHIKQNILIITPASLVEAGDDAKEAEAKHDRLVMTALVALAFVFSHVPGAADAELAAEILTAKMLWKLAQGSSPHTRAALADCTAAAAKFCPSLLEPVMKKAAGAVFACVAAAAAARRLAKPHRPSIRRLYEGCPVQSPRVPSVPRLCEQLTHARLRAIQFPVRFGPSSPSLCLECRTVPQHIHAGTCCFTHSLSYYRSCCSLVCVCCVLLLL